MVSYCQALAHLFALERFGEKLDLSGPTALNEALGRPLDSFRSVLIGGTNGKGSTAAFTEALLRGAGLKVGLFTSPHLMSFRERVRIDGKDISAERVATLTTQVLDTAQGAKLQPSFFEATWGLAALAFAQAELDIVIWEVGLGGRLDATNVCAPDVSAVTCIALDHMRVLGDSLTQIAGEKAAIFRPGKPALTAATGPGLIALQSHGPVESVVIPELSNLPLPGIHQQHNAALAIAVVNALGHSPNRAHLSQARWPGRGERIQDVILDCAHNPDGAQTFATWLEQDLTGPIHLICGAMADKNVEGLFAPILPFAASVAVVRPDTPRAMAADELAARLNTLAQDTQIQVIPRVSDALDHRPRACTTVVIGSCYLAGEARAHLLGVSYPECDLRTRAR